MRTVRIGDTTLRLVRRDITEQEADAVVNAANSGLLGGGGVDGEIHRRGGPEILAECRDLRADRYADGLPTGDAVATTAGRLPTRRVIHAVGPRWKGGGCGEAELLASAYRESLKVAREEGLRTVAFPAISTGAYGYPLEAATRIAIATVSAIVREHRDGFDEVRFVVFSDADMQVYEEALAEMETIADHAASTSWTMSDAAAPEGVRLDRWLWAARFYKTRSLAAEAAGGGKVEVGGQRAKRARLLHVGDELRIRKGPFEHRITVRALSEQRRGAPEAQALYEETAASRAARETLAAELKANRSVFPPSRGKPSKKQRRDLRRLKSRNRPR